MNIEIGCYVGFDPVEEAAELDGAIARIILADDPPGRYIQGGKQARSAVLRANSHLRISDG